MMEIELVGFINPHLFWVAEQSPERDDILANISKEIRKSNVGLEYNYEFQVDQMVCVQTEGELVRATIEDILFDDTTNGPVYYCWLVDYGRLIISEKIFKLPSIIQKIPKQIKQACLKNVCYIKKSLELGAYGGKMKSIPTVIPESGIYHYARSLLENNEKLWMDVAEVENEILYGDITVFKSRRKFSLFEELAAKGLIMEDRVIFEKIKHGIDTYKKTHLRTIHQLTMTTTPPSKFEITPEDKNCLYDDVNEYMMKPLENGRRRRAKAPEISSSTSDSSMSDIEQRNRTNTKLALLFAKRKELANRVRSNSETESCVEEYASANSNTQENNSKSTTELNTSHGDVTNGNTPSIKVDSMTPSRVSKIAALLANKKSANIDNVTSTSNVSNNEDTKNLKACKLNNLSTNVQHFEYLTESNIITSNENDTQLERERKPSPKNKIAAVLARHIPKVSSSDTNGNIHNELTNKATSVISVSELEVGPNSDDDRTSITTSKTSEMLKKLRSKNKADNAVRKTESTPELSGGSKTVFCSDIPSDKENKDSAKSKSSKLLEMLKASRKKQNISSYIDEGSDLSFENAMSSTKSDGLDSSYKEESQEISNNQLYPEQSTEEKNEECSVKLRKSDSNPSKPKVLPFNFMPAGYQVKPKAKPAARQSKRPPKSSTEDDVPSVKPRKLMREGPEAENKSSSVSETESDGKTETDNTPVQTPNFGNSGVKIPPPYALHGCACAECRQAYDDDDWEAPVKFSDTVCKRKIAAATAKVPIIKPPKLLKLAGTENELLENEIVSIKFSEMTKLKRQAAHKILIHGEALPDPVQLLAQTCLAKEILEDLRRHDYKEPKRVQSYSYPALTRNQHVFMVSDRDSGKTMTYLPVLYSFILEKDDRYKLLSKMGGGPIAVILCNSSNKCELVHDYAKKIFGRQRQVRLHLETYPGRSNVSNIDILITIPAVLNALLSSNAINFKRLCHFVLEDGVVILEKHSSLVLNFMTLADKVLEHRNCPKAIQVVVCAEHWTPKIEQLFKMLKKVPLVCIGNYLEAALYGKMTFALKFLDSACKEVELKKLLSDVYKFEKSVVVCSDEQVEEIQTMFILWGINYTAIQNDMKVEDITYLEEVWNRTPGGHYSVLICSDYVYSKILSVTSANILVHYSLPKTWSQFIRRFSCLLEKCPTPLNVSKRKEKIISVVLIDEHCEPHMSKFASYLGKSSLKDQLPKELESFFEMTRAQLEEKKLAKKIDFCQNLKIFGKCENITCPSRHLLDKKQDVCEQLPQNGTIKFKILTVHDVTCYSIHILQHYDLKNNKTEFCDRTEEIVEKLTHCKRKPLHTPKLNHTYMYEDENRGRERVKLLNVQEELLADVFLIDKGIQRKIKVENLFKLSDELKEIPPQTIDVYLANLIPPMQDANFSAKAYRKIQFILDENDLQHSIMSAEIHLQLGKNLWLKDVIEERELYDKSLPSMGYQLSRQIAKLHMAEASEEPLRNLYQLCKEAHIELPEYQIAREKKKSTIVEQAAPQWAFLDFAGTNEVMFSCAVSPDEFYVKIKKFIKQLEQLEKEIQTEIRRPMYPEVKNIEVGKCYLAPDAETGEYARAIVKEVTEDGNVYCYFVDHGDEILAPTGEIKHITNSMISKLPFQSIQCRLTGVKAIDEEWDNAATDLLYDFGYEPNTDPKQIRTLYLRVGTREENYIMPRQRSYAVLIKGGSGAGRKLLNNLMIDCGLAIPNDEKVEDFNVPEFIQTEDDNDFDYDDFKDIDNADNGQIDPYCEELDEEKYELKEEDIDICVFDQEGFVRDCVSAELVDMIKQMTNITKNSEDQSVPTTSKITEIKTDNLVPMKALPNVDYFTPTCIWSQTDKDIKLTIKIPDVREYEIGVISQGRIFKFSTYKEEKKYLLKIMLFEKVEKTFQHSALGLVVKVTLTKLKSEVEWPRLSFSQETFRHIHYDIDSIQFEDDEKKKRILTFDVSDDSTDSEEERDPIFTYLVSDVDSEYDNDIPNDDQ